MLSVEVAPQRVAIDRNRVTRAGVTSGIDFGLTLLELLCEDQVAKMTQLMTQLMMEYTPEQPFDADTPETAGKDVVRSLMQFGKPLLDAFQTQTQKVVTGLNIPPQFCVGLVYLVTSASSHCPFLPLQTPSPAVP
jgi:cyclohexyl-isocyanide hydratase